MTKEEDSEIREAAKQQGQEKEDKDLCSDFDYSEYLIEF